MESFPKFDFIAFERKISHKVKKLADLSCIQPNVIDFAKYQRSLSKDERMELEERAAIMEYDGGLPRQQAEQHALQNVIYMKDYKNDKSH